MNPLLFVLAETTTTGAESSGGSWLFLLLGPAGAGAVYWGLYRYYRNTDRTHDYEAQAKVEAQPVRSSDRLLRRITATSRSAIEGDNSRDHRRRVTRIT